MTEGRSKDHDCELKFKATSYSEEPDSNRCLSASGYFKEMLDAKLSQINVHMQLILRKFFLTIMQKRVFQR